MTLIIGLGAGICIATYLIVATVSKTAEVTLELASGQRPSDAPDISDGFGEPLAGHTGDNWGSSANSRYPVAAESSSVGGRQHITVRVADMESLEPEVGADVCAIEPVAPNSQSREFVAGKAIVGGHEQIVARTDTSGRARVELSRGVKDLLIVAVTDLGECGATFVDAQADGHYTILVSRSQSCRLVAKDENGVSRAAVDIALYVSIAGEAAELIGVVTTTESGDVFLKHAQLIRQLAHAKYGENLVIAQESGQRDVIGRDSHSALLCHAILCDDTGTVSPEEPGWHDLHALPPQLEVSTGECGYLDIRGIVDAATPASDRETLSVVVRARGFVRPGETHVVVGGGERIVSGVRLTGEPVVTRHLSGASHAVVAVSKGRLLEVEVDGAYLAWPVRRTISGPSLDGERREIAVGPGDILHVKGAVMGIEPGAILAAWVGGTVEAAQVEGSAPGTPGDALAWLNGPISIGTDEQGGFVFGIPKEDVSGWRTFFVATTPGLELHGHGIIGAPLGSDSANLGTIALVKEPVLLAGRVVDIDGRAVQGARVWMYVFPNEMGGWPGGDARTNDNGEFVFVGSWPRTIVTVEVLAAGGHTGSARLATGDQDARIVLGPR